MAHTKEEWRQLLNEARRALEASLRAAHSRVIAARVVARPEFVSCDALLVYVPIGAEVDPTLLASDGHRSGKAIYQPHGRVSEPRWRRYRPSDDAGHLACDGPPAVVIPQETGILVIVPGVGFDLEGVRLGRGGGFYDRALVNLRNATSVFAVGIAFEAQIAPCLPCDPWDQRVDLIVTEQRCIVPRSSLDPPRVPPQAEEEVREP